MKARWWLVGVLGAGLSGGVVACGGDADGSSGGAKLEDVPARFAAAQCAAFRGCFGPLADIYFSGQSCEERFTKVVEQGNWPEVIQAVESGRAKYTPSKLQGCLDRMREGSCGSINTRDLPECVAAFDGSVAAGGDCTLDAECASGTYCKMGSTCPGKCTARGAAGAECEEEEHCASGLVCSPEGRCVAPAKLGEACDAGAPECEPGLLCMGADDQARRPGSCRTQADALSSQQGEVCSPSEGKLCKDLAPCAFDGIVGQQPVFKCIAPVAKGGACAIAFPDPCQADEWCSGIDTQQGVFTGTCRPLAGEGEPCSDGFGKACRPGAACDDGVCRTVQERGGACSSDVGCYSDRCSGGTCVANSPCSTSP